jgi:hypothetical protein
MVPVLPKDISATFYWKDGSKSKCELYYGTSFQSQSGRHLLVNKRVEKIEIMQSTGEKRIVNLPHK